MSQSDYSELVRLLTHFADKVSAFMQTPTFWNHFPVSVISMDTDFSREPDLLGDRFGRELKPDFTELCAECCICGKADIAKVLDAGLKGSVDYLNAASDFLNMHAPIDCPSRDVIPDEVCRDYTMGRETPVDELLILIAAIVKRSTGRSTAGHDGPVTAELLRNIAGCSDKLIKNSLDHCPKLKSGNRGGPTEWLYQTALSYLRSAESPTVKKYPWPDSLSELNSSKIPARKSIR